jgi:hypothetical protein
MVVDCVVGDVAKMAAVAIEELVEEAAEEQENLACSESAALFGHAAVVLADLLVLSGVQGIRCSRHHQCCCHRTWSPRRRKTGLPLD